MKAVPGGRSHSPLALIENRSSIPKSQYSMAEKLAWGILTYAGHEACTHLHQRIPFDQTSERILLGGSTRSGHRLLQRRGSTSHTW